MKFRKGMIIFMLAVFILSMATASASEIDSGTNDEDSGHVLLAVNNEAIEETQSNHGILGEDEGTYSDLSSEIDGGGNKNLTKSYYCYTAGDAGTPSIEITTSGVIDGKGAIIDMDGSNIWAFNVVASGVTIKNLTIKNANFNDKGAAIYFGGSGSVENCSFINNKAKFGGAINFDIGGSVTDCNFTDNYAGYGGAVHFSSSGTVHDVINCNFLNNTASAYGGAILSQGSINVMDCNFIDNSASEGGALHFKMMVR